MGENKNKYFYQALVFICLTFIVTSFFHYKFIFDGGLEQNADLIIFLMWTPGVVGILCSLLFGYRLKDIGFQRISLNGMLIAFLVPAICAGIVFALLLLFGIDSFGIRDKFYERFANLNGILVNTFLYTPTVGMFFGYLRAIGEEIGWRGFLHDKFYKADIRHPYFWTGIIWALWHLPLILFADYATSDLPYFSATLFVVVAVSFSIFMGWQREVTGSVWVAGMAHVSHNMWMQAIYPRFLKKGPLDQYFGGESGIFLAVIYFCLAAYIWRRRKEWRRKFSPPLS